MQPDERLAVIDLGSNSFRLVVFLAGAGWWKRTDEIYEPVRIGEGLASSGQLGREPIARALATLDVFAPVAERGGGRRGGEPIARALATLDVFAQFAKASGLDADSIDAVATSAIRDASNAESFLDRARERS